jgi:hypothetical protein
MDLTWDCSGNPISIHHTSLIFSLTVGISVLILLMLKNVWWFLHWPWSFVKKHSHVINSSVDWHRKIKFESTNLLKPFFFLWCWGLTSEPTPWATPLALFLVMDFFQDGVLWTICPGWLQMAILLISAF